MNATPEMLAALFPVIRGLIFTTLLLLIGVQVAGSITRKTLAEIDQSVDTRVTVWLLQLPRLLATFLLPLCLMRSAAQALSFTMPGEPFDVEFAKGVVMSGPWGRANLFQTIVAALLFGGATLLRHQPRPMRLLVGLALPVLLWFQTGMGHAADDVWYYGAGRVLDVFHLVGGGIWLGTLAILSIAVLPSLRGDANLASLGRVISAFSKYARLGAVLIVISGGLAALRYYQSIDAMLASDWGKRLLIKLAFFFGVLLLGAWNWRRVTPALLQQEPGSEQRLRSAIRYELILGAFLLAVTALLVGSELPKGPAEIPDCSANGSSSCQPTSMRQSQNMPMALFADSKSAKVSTNRH